MAAVSFSVLFTCGMIYQTPPENEEQEEENDSQSDNGSEEEDEEEDVDDPNEIKYHDSIWKNKPLLLFLLSTYLLNFGYYVPYVHLVSFIYP